MPNWRNTLPPEGKHQGFQLRRTPQNGPLAAIITCEQLLVADTHYWHGRTTPCERKANDRGETLDDSTCPACREKIGYRTHVYVSAYDPKRSEHFLFECTTCAAKPLAEYLEAVGTLRGCILRATRPKGTPNGKVAIETATANQQRVPLPEPPDVIMALAVIWRLPLAAVCQGTQKADNMDTKAGYARRQPAATIDPNKLREQRNQPDNAKDPPTLGEIIAGNGHAKRAKAIP